MQDFSKNWNDRKMAASDEFVKTQMTGYFGREPKPEDQIADEAGGIASLLHSAFAAGASWSIEDREAIEDRDKAALPDGLYFISDDRSQYAKVEPDTVAAPPATKYIGVKMGDKAIAVALHDLPGDEDGELQLLPRGHRSPEASEHYSWDSDRCERRFNVFEDFDGKGNTERLKSYGCEIKLPEGEWIPSMGEIGIIMMNLTAVNKALKLAGGEPLKVWYWSSTELSQYSAWVVYFSDGYTSNNYKYSSNAVRAVAAF